LTLRIAGMWKWLGLGVLAILAVLSAVVAAQPSEFEVKRSLVMPVPPAAVFAQVEDFKKWARWSPWEKLDPTMKKHFSGPPTGVGASYHWVGNDQVGEGRMTIVNAAAPNRIEIRLEFMKPWKATNPTMFSFEPEGAGTRTTWSMTGKNDFIGKAFSLAMDMDALVGADFDKGLAALAQAAATSP
jgi:uncharacterized protein YndB with AHSA1/START domain